MNSIVNHMCKYDHRQHVLSDWLAELEQRFQLGEVDDNKSKITWCQLLIGATGSSILSGLEDDASWETAKETLLSRLGIGSMKDEAWAALKHYKKGSKEIVELAVDTFLGALERPLAAEVRKLGCHTMESMVTAARRIEKVQAEQADPEKELQIKEQIRLLQEGLEDARKQIAQPPATPTANSAAQPLSRLLPLATPTGNTMRRTLIIVHRADHGAGNLHNASSVEKRGISPTTAQPAQPSSASYVSKHTLALTDNPRSPPRPRMAPKNPLPYRFGC